MASRKAISVRQGKLVFAFCLFSAAALSGYAVWSLIENNQPAPALQPVMEQIRAESDSRDVIIFYQGEPYYSSGLFSVPRSTVEKQVGLIEQTLPYQENGLYEAGTLSAVNLNVSSACYAVKGKPDTLAYASDWDGQYYLAVKDKAHYEDLYDLEYLDFPSCLYELFPAVFKADFATRAVLSEKETATLCPAEAAEGQKQEANCVLALSTTGLKMYYPAFLDSEDKRLLITDPVHNKYWKIDLMRDQQGTFENPKNQ